MTKVIGGTLLAVAGVSLAALSRYQGVELLPMLTENWQQVMLQHALVGGAWVLGTQAVGAFANHHAASISNLTTNVLAKFNVEIDRDTFQTFIETNSELIGNPTTSGFMYCMASVGWEAMNNSGEIGRHGAELVQTNFLSITDRISNVVEMAKQIPADVARTALGIAVSKVFEQ